MKSQELTTWTLRKMRHQRWGALSPPMALAPCLLAVVVFSGCQSKPEPDNRPSWVQEAEARLQRPPSWQVSGSGVDSGGESETRSSFFGSGQATTASTGGSQQDKQSSRGSASGGQPTTESEPPGVEWSETKITVSVED